MLHELIGNKCAVFVFVILFPTGLGNDTLGIMKFKFGNLMEKFYTDNHFHSGGSPGGQFCGKVIRQIISHKSLAKLSLLLGSAGDVYVKYLASFRELYRICVQKKFREDFEVVVTTFKHAFEEMHKACGLSETPKVKGIISVELN